MQQLYYLPDLVPGTALWIGRAESAENLQSLLTAGECEFLSTQGLSVARQQEWTLGRAALKQLLSLQYDWAPRELEILSVKSRPCLTQRPASPHKTPQLSLSHKKEFVMAGVSEWALGVDIETRSDAVGKTQAMQRACSEQESREADAEQQMARADLLTLLWCLKESLVKAGFVSSVFATKAFSLRLDLASHQGALKVFRASSEALPTDAAWAVSAPDFAAACVRKTPSFLSTACG